MLAGYVCLIGAGPGNPGLITLQGLEYLHRAEVVIFDHLAPSQLLLETKPDCELISAGKEGGKPSISQTAINELLISGARKGKFVVRLKGGDPFLLGRGGEEAQALVDANIPYILVPGVSASYSVPAYAGIPVTDRRVCSGVEVSTGHKLREDERPNTQVVLMALNKLEEVVAGLQTRGYSEETPACLISRGTTSQQRLVTGKLSTITFLARKMELATPALLVAGESVNYAKTLDWRKNLPLAGKRILWTRPSQKQEPPVLDELSLYGAEVIRFPVYLIQPAPNVVLEELFQQIREYSVIVFTSASAVDIFFKYLLKKEEDWRYLGFSRIAAIGGKTAQALKERGRNPDLVAPMANSQGLLHSLSTSVNPEDQVALCRAGQTLPLLSEGLLKAEIPFRDFTIYDVACPVYPIELVQGIFNIPLNLIVLTSPLAVTHLHRITAEAGVEIAESTRFACLGTETASALGKTGSRPWLTQNEPDVAVLIQKILSEWGMV
jgi:uroporphyrinogen III methyltransferase/synthase